MDREENRSCVLIARHVFKNRMFPIPEGSLLGSQGFTVDLPKLHGRYPVRRSPCLQTAWFAFAAAVRSLICFNILVYMRRLWRDHILKVRLLKGSFWCGGSLSDYVGKPAAVAATNAWTMGLARRHFAVVGLGTVSRKP